MKRIVIDGDATAHVSEDCDQETINALTAMIRYIRKEYPQFAREEGNQQTKIKFNE